MPPPLTAGQSKYDLVIDPAGTIPIRLMLDRQKFAAKNRPLEFDGAYLPIEGGQASSIPVAKWEWQNGKAGAGWGIETTASYEAGACDYGTFVWLRKLGAAQPAGQLTEVSLAGCALTTLFTTGSFTSALQWGGSEDLFLTTRKRTVIKIPNGTGAPFEYDLGATGETVGLAAFDVADVPYLYVGDPRLPIHVWDGTVWTSGAAGTEREWLATVYWTIGDALATGGAAGSGGSGGARLLGTRADGTGFYHVSGDPKTANNWSSLTRIRPNNTTILKMVASNRHAYFGKSDGVYDCDELGHTPNLTKGIELAASTNNFRALAFWAGKVWGATEQGLMAFEPDGERVDLPQYVQFGAGASNASPIWGRPRALAVCPQGLYVGFYNNVGATSDSYIGLLMLDPDGTYRWSMAEAVIPSQQITLIHQTSPGGVPRVWYGTVDATGHFHLYWQSQPLTGDPDLDATHSGPFVPALDWTVRLSRTNNGTGDEKTYRRLMTESKRIGTAYPANSIDFRLSADDGAFTTQGTATTGTRWSAAPLSGHVRATNVQVELAVHNAANAPVIVYSAGMQYNRHPELTKAWRLPLIAGKNVTGQDPRVTLILLEQAQDRGPLTMQFLGMDIEGVVEPGIGQKWVEEAPKQYTVHIDATISITNAPSLFDQALHDVDDWS